MFKILELRNGDPAAAVEIGHRYSTREKAMAAVKAYLKTFKVSGRNPEGNYWWARDSEGLRKCWISADSKITDADAQLSKSKPSF